MTTAPISLQDLRRRIYVKAKAEPTWRFWGLYVHVCKMEKLQEAYRMAKSNNGAPGIDGVTFDALEESGAESFLKRKFSGRTSPQHVSAHAGTEEGDSVAMPVIVAMDSNAQAFPLPMDPTYSDFIAAGYSDVWQELLPSVPG